MYQMKTLLYYKNEESLVSLSNIFKRNFTVVTVVANVSIKRSSNKRHEKPNGLHKRDGNKHLRAAPLGSSSTTARHFAVWRLVTS